MRGGSYVLTRIKAIMIAVTFDALVAAGVALGLLTHSVEPPVLIMLAFVLFSGTSALLVLALRPAKTPRTVSDPLAGYAVSSSLESHPKS